MQVQGTKGIATESRLRTWMPSRPGKASPDEPPKSALRSANHYQPDAQQNAKLKALSVPFWSSLIPFDPDSRAPAKETALGYGLSPADLRAINPEDSSPEKLDALRKILTLQYAGQTEILKYNIKQAILQFSRGTNDTGSPEVQAAIWTVRIAMLEHHVKTCRHDYCAERKLVEYKDQRRKILKYLKRVSLERYYTCLDRLGLPHDLVEAAISYYPALKASHIERLKRKEVETVANAALLQFASKQKQKGSKKIRMKN